MNIRLMEKEDIEGASSVHKLAFIRQRSSVKWIECNLGAFPRSLIFVVEKKGVIIGYIIWIQKSGFRSEVVIELEQLAITPDLQGFGIGRRLINESLPLLKKQLALNNSVLKHILVTTRADNFAQKLYRETLGAEVEATISNLYSADEVLMIARNVNTD